MLLLNVQGLLMHILSSIRTLHATPALKQKAVTMLQSTARPKLQRAVGDETAFQQEPILLQSSPHRPTCQKASSGSGRGSNPGIALTGTTSHTLSWAQH